MAHPPAALKRKASGRSIWAKSKVQSAARIPIHIGTNIPPGGLGGCETPPAGSALVRPEGGLLHQGRRGVDNPPPPGPQSVALQEFHQAVDAVAGVGVVSTDAGGGEALRLPEGAGAGVGLQHGKVQMLCRVRQVLDMGQEGRAVALGAGGGGKDHQAKVGVLRLGKAEGQFRHAAKVTVKVQAKPVRSGGVAAGRGPAVRRLRPGGHHLLRHARRDVVPLGHRKRDVHL